MSAHRALPNFCEALGFANVMRRDEKEHLWTSEFCDQESMRGKEDFITTKREIFQGFL